MNNKDFWKNVSGSNPNECWLWTGSTAGRIYGYFKVNGKKWIASRYAFTLIKGEIPAGMFVCHTCDNPKCVNPNHLFLGTAKDNAYDCIHKGRATFQNHELKPKNLGNTIYAQKLNLEKANHIRSLFNTGRYTRRELSSKFNVSKRNICYILRGQIWRNDV